ncbi:sugar phosphate isomerase/epimerase family protein [Blastochloris viridis]|uniref:Hydroxypyruvate isomerase n=1 Tax=Blastochloris viridis TaxID=1079 RepID=A0A0H5BBV4_BLAVI|nr:TIM barrel protein [Blastochloris viridis]ALK10326.1 Xylose isomerase-like TIM barrel [Blastochloris viridis]BAR99742.1 nitrogen-fixing NifU [Blastochloris viridis]CUU42988.1 Hydroxypyruvate isomerase [Blastochloris viridis]
MTDRASRRLSISNIAWPADADTEAIDCVAKLGFDGVELAPGKVFGDLGSVALDDVRAYRRRLEQHGLSVPALQALLFGVAGVHLFESAAPRARMAAHLRRVAAIAGALGAGACVFGAPALRDPGALPHEAALAIATEFLRDLAPAFADEGTVLCFEANPARSGCRFVTATAEAFALVERVNAPGIALQLDTGTMFANDEEPGVVAGVARRIGHVRILRKARC